jgi:hypothetical protein
MTRTRISVYCDLCTDELITIGPTPDDARAIAAEHLWTRSEGRDLCPACAANEADEAERNPR